MVVLGNEGNGGTAIAGIRSVTGKIQRSEMILIPSFCRKLVGRYSYGFSGSSHSVLMMR